MEMETNLMKGYTDAYNLAAAELSEKVPAEVCLNASVSYDTGRNSYRVTYLGADYLIHPGTGEVLLADSNQEVSVTVKILLMHYLAHAGNKPLSGNLISFRELKNGASVYDSTFQKRAVSPLVKQFEKNLETLYRCSEKLSGNREQYGHASVTIRVLPMVPVTYVLWEGDEEVPASGTILFDSSVESFLPAEDIVVAGSFGTYELIRLKNELVN